MTIPGYINKKGNIVKLVLFTAVFALVFINIYKPFGAKSWYNVSDFKFFLFSAPVILTGVLVVVISRVIMYYYNKFRKVTYVNYFFWVFFEILLMSLFYTIYTLSLDANANRDVIETFNSATVNTALVLLLPYITLWFYFGWIDSKKRLEDIEHADAQEGVLPRNITFSDEKGVLRLSIQNNELLYIESDDNYAIVHYTVNGKVKRYLLRNTLKNLEKQFTDTPVGRCHRSFLVNFGRVMVMRREREGLFLELDAEGEKDIPVSKSYRDKVGEKFLSQSFKNQN